MAAKKKKSTSKKRKPASKKLSASVRKIALLCAKIRVAKKAAPKKRKAAKRKTAKRKTSHRDPSWYGEPKRHAKAAKKGHRAQGHTIHRRDPAWFGHSKAHSKAAKKGARHAAAHRGTGRISGKAWHAKMQRAKAAKARHHRPSHRDPMTMGSPGHMPRRSRLGRRQGAASPWYVSHDPSHYGPRHGSGKGHGRGR